MSDKNSSRKVKTSPLNCLPSLFVVVVFCLENKYGSNGTDQDVRVLN